MKINIKLLALLGFFLFAGSFVYAQNYNKDVEAKIKIDTKENNVSITGFSINKQAVYQELRYVLSVFKTGDNGNKSTNKQSGRFVLDANKRKLLSETTVNISNKNKVIALLLIYDLNDNIVGKDRVELVGDKNELIIKQNVLKKLNTKKKPKVVKSDQDDSKKDGVEIVGLVIEDTLTKLGRDFYSLFNNLYVFNEINGKQVVKIKEVFALGRNTKIEVFAGDRKVFNFFVRPQKEYLTKMGDYALIKVYRHFKSLERLEQMIEQY